ncbi:WD40 repeat-containing protein, putative, partial [Bodo saltans]
MEAKLQRQEQSVARFASIALLHLSLDSKKQKQQQKQLQQRRQGDDDEDDASTLWMTDAPTITLPQLMSLRSVFDSAPDGLSEEEFVSAFKKVGSRLSETHLRWWFRRIDADDSGNVDWHELSTFIISGSVDESGRIVAHDERPEDAMFAKEEKGVSMPATEASPNAIAGLNHSDFVTSVYCHPRNGKYFTGSQDGTVRVWDAQTMEFEYILHQGKWVTCMCASPDDTQLFVAGLDRTIVVYELTNLTKTPRYYVGNILDENHRVPKGRPIHRFEISTRHMVDPSASGVSGYRPGESLESFRLRNDRIRHSKIPDQTVEAYVLREMEFPANVMVCVPNSEILFMGLSSGRLQGYPLVHRSLLKGRFVECYMDVNPHENFPVTTLQYAEFFNGFLSTAADGSVALTDVRGQSVVKVGIAATPIYHAIWMEGPKLLATCGASRDISLWSASPQTSTTTLRGHYCSVVQLAFDANDNWLVSLDAERTIVIWNMHNLLPIQSITDYETYQLGRFSAMAADGSVALTDVRGQSVVKVGIAATPIYHAIWMEGPKLLATCGASRDISLWSASPQTSTTTLRGHYCSVVQLAFDANDNWLVSLDAERTIVIWNMHNLLPIQSITDYETYQLGRFSAMVYDATRNRILCASTAPVIFTKGTTSVPLADPSYKGHQRPLVGCLYNRVFHQIITADSECIKIWEAANGQQRSCLSIPSLRATGVPMKYAGGGSILSIRQDSSHRRLIISLSSATICIMSISNCHLVLECHRSTVKLPSSIDAGGSMFIPLPNSRVGKKGFGLVLGNKLLLWEDKDSVSNVPIGHEISFQMKAEQYETISRQQQTPLPPAFHARRNANLWRTPAPTCLASAEGLIAVGTDCGIVLVYLTTGIEPLGFIGAYEPSTIVTSLCWHEQSSSFVFSLSNGRVMFAHAFHRNKLIAICHEDDTNDPVAVLSLDEKKKELQLRVLPQQRSCYVC